MIPTSPEGWLVLGLWDYTARVLEPARALKRAGLPVGPAPAGEPPQDIPAPGLGPRFSREWDGPRMLDAPTEHDHLVVEFDRMGEVYDAFVRPFSQAVFGEALDELAAWMRPDARVLDAGCGVGRELRAVARRVPDGEVVGIDLAAGMVRAAHDAARSHGLDNCAFAQADVGALPEELTGAFDAAYNCLAHHHYPDPPRAAREILRCLRPGGVYAIVDPGPAWFTRISAPFAKWSDPGWIGFHTPEEFRALLLGTGFERFWWHEVLPGFGLAVAQKPA
jgi:ubiquinone/menaquinone biosynthesis C-methylase UbiE